MNILNFRFGTPVNAMLAVAATLAALGGCGGGGGASDGGGTVTPPPPVLPGSAGKIVDGYLIGATVCLDLNDDRIFQASEPCVVTGADGSFAFPGQGLHMVRSVGGVDNSTNTPFIGELRAPAGATVITPLTTLVVADVESRLPTPVANTVSALAADAVTTAETAVKSNLGISASVALSTTDPVKAAKDNPNDAIAAKLVQQNTAVQTLLQQTARAVAAATGLSAPTAAQAAAIYKEATRTVATLAAAPASATSAINLSSTTTTFVNTVTSNTVTRAKTSADVLASLPPTQVTALAALAPASVAAMATKSIADQVKAVSDAPAATLVAAAAESTAAGNPALAAFKSTDMQLAISSAAPLLTTTVAAVNSPAVLQNLSASIVSALSTASGGAGAAGAAAAAVTSIINEQMVTTSLAVPAANIALVNATAIQTTQSAANSAVSTAIAGAATTVASATTTTLAGATTTVATTTTTKAPTTTTAAPTTTTSTTTTSTSTTTTTTTTTTAGIGNGSRISPSATPTSFDDVLDATVGNVIGAAVSYIASGKDQFVIALGADNSIARSANVRIFNFGTGNKLVFKLASPTTLGALSASGTFAVADNGTDISVIGNNGGIVQQITLVGKTGSRSSVGGSVDNLVELNTFLGGSAVEVF